MKKIVYFISCSSLILAFFTVSSTCIISADSVESKATITVHQGEKQIKNKPKGKLPKTNDTSEFFLQMIGGILVVTLILGQLSSKYQKEI